MTNTWTKELVQEHAQVAVAIELYTLPFYITALASIKDTNSDAFNLVRSVMMEEMLHLELAANLCLALDTVPNFSPPVYGQPIPYLKPYDPETGDHAFLNASLDRLNAETLDMMLDIETPKEFEASDHTTPQYPYDSIGEMYNALLAGITQVGEDQFSWTTANQQNLFGEQSFQSIISSYSDAVSAVNAICEQGEGKSMSPVPTPPFKETDFPIPTEYQLVKEGLDPAPYNAYSHYGRFVKIKNEGLPETYSGVSNPRADQNVTLQDNFSKLLRALNTIWTTGQDTGEIWLMTSLLSDAQNCWKHDVIPQWS